MQESRTYLEFLSIFIDLQLLDLVGLSVRRHEDCDQVDFTACTEGTERVLDVEAARGVGDVKGLRRVGAENERMICRACVLLDSTDLD